MKPVVAIDGPSGAGKSTVARQVAAALDFEVLDTGAMYRAVTLAALEAHVDLADEAACAALAKQVTIEQRGVTTRLDGRDVSAEIRSAAVTAAVSTVSAHPSVRAVLVEHQRAWVAARPGGVVEGRDIGTVVFPDAAVKVFLTASEVERARRRRDEAHPSAPVGAVQAELERRDHLDSTRATSPLQPAPDALRIDTTDRPVDEVVRVVVDAFAARTATPR
ncbi:MAG TPA: (d)CMP kinase [Acidimicrobiia bacterium]|nr:(d)CMP kinase [Acidimicrobiia bacterium]